MKRMPETRSALERIYTPIESDLDAFFKRFRSELTCEHALLRDINEHLLRMMGKYLRPALALLSARTQPKPARDVVPLAVAIELIHTATLVHDDIIDDSEMRRNLPSVFSKWGREISIVAGDYLYAKCFQLLSELEDTWIHSAFSSCARRICEGEMRQIENRRNFSLSEETYLEIIERKTAVLFEAACLGGAHLAGAPQREILALGRYGLELGLAFQIVDDCLDLVGDSTQLGKTVGLDIHQSDMTLPLLYLFADLDAARRRELVRSFESADPALFETIRSLAREHGSVERALERARVHAERARGQLSGLPPSASRDSLEQLVAHCVDRVR